MRTGWVAVGAAAAGLGVALGAFAAHGLRSHVTLEALATFETGVRYQMYHALAIVMVARAASRWQGRWPQVAGWLFLAGIALFSGSLYLLTLTGAAWIGVITPIGGVAFIGGWAAFATAAVQAR